VAGILSVLVPGLGQFYNGQWIKGLGYLIGQGAVLGSVLYLVMTREEGGLGLFLLLFLFPIAMVISSASNAVKNGSADPPGRNILVLPFRIIAGILLWVESYTLRHRVGVIKSAFLVILMGNAVWMTPAGYVGAASSLTDANYKLLTLPEKWYFLALMPAKNTAAGVLVLVILLTFILYMRAIRRGTIQWGKIEFSSQFALIFLAFSAIWTMGLMGLVRSALRKYFHVYDLVPDLSPESNTPTLGETSVVITILTLVFFAVVSLAIWLAIGTGRDKAKG
jgi:cytochrome d ubiquinol oxidase subunit I